MGKTFRDLGVVTTITSAYILAVSREDIDEAFKTTINDIKTYILESGGVNALFTDLTIGILRTDSADLSGYVNTSTEIINFDSSSIQLERMIGLTTATTYLDIGSFFDFKIAGGAGGCKLSSSEIQTAQLVHLSVDTARISLGSSLEVYPTAGAPRLRVIAGSTHNVLTNKVTGLTTAGNSLDLEPQTIVLAGGNPSLVGYSNGEIDMPKRSIIAAWGQPDQSLSPNTYYRIRFANEITDPLNQYNPSTWVINMQRAGTEFQFILQVHLVSTAWLSTDVVELMGNLSGEPKTPSQEIDIPMVQGTYGASLYFVGSFVSDLTADREFGIRSTKASTLTASRFIIKPVL